MNASRDLIVVITAAILAMTDGKTNIVIKAIKRKSNSASNWAFAGRRKLTWK